MAHRSISLRLTIWFSSVFFAGLVLFGAVMWFDLHDTLTSGRSRTLERRAERLSELLTDTRADSPAQRASKFKAFADATGGGLIDLLQTDGTRALPAPTAAAHAFPWPAPAHADRDRFSEVAYSGQPYRVLERPFTSGAQSLVLCVAAPLEGNRQVLRAFTAGLLWTIPALLALAALGGYVLSRRALKPVDQITTATRSISVSSLSERLPVPQTGDELQRLSETCNAMLARLESSVREIKRFTDDASHELRSPVSFVRTTAELALRNRELDAASRRAFEEIVTECGKANRLLKDMLTLARADAGNSRLAFEPVDLVELVRAIAPKAHGLAAEHGHILTVSLDEGCDGMVWGDYSTIQRLIWILLDNAAKYTPAPGSIRVMLTGDGKAVTLAVEDNGIGIAAANLPQIFGRFYRADPSRSRVEGFGLGLSIAVWVANVHQASISADSREGSGSVFKVVFPVLAVDPRRPRTAMSEGSLTNVS